MTCTRRDGCLCMLMYICPVLYCLLSSLAPRGGKDEAFAQEAKEFLRSRLIGHKVKVINEYQRAPPKESGDQTVRQHVSVFLPNKV